ncbi:MAG TPA: HAMP domain-containing sensor histidine kinase [Candidatus Limnocylindria bacterium]|jgi:signal transduction histidine kinase
MTLIRAATGETQLPAPPQAPAPEDFPAVPVLEPPRLPSAHGAGLGLGITLVVALAVGIEWLSADAIQTAPVLFLAVVAAAWWLDRTSGLAVALVAGVLWTAVAFAASQTFATGVSAAALVGSLIGIAIAVSAARTRERRLRMEELRREQARMILAVQLRESVVSIDVAVPLLADPMKLDRAQGAAFDQVRRHARGLTRLANDLLTLDQMDTRKMALTMVPVDLAAFVLEITEQRVPHDRATIVAPSTPVQVHADPERLRQLFDHLLQNALKFSAPSAGIMVKVSAGADEARVEVRDHGVGLSADDMQVLFTRYGRIRDARTANVPGMGLGLYLAKLIAEAHGGDLVASSAGRGLGATFTVVLPIAGRPRRPHPQRELPASSFWD